MFFNVGVFLFMIDNPIIYPVLFFAGILSGIVNAVAGGGGLISLPALLAVGIPPQIALGTNKFQASFGHFTSAAYYLRHDVVTLKSTRLGIIFTVIGAAAGSYAVQRIDNSLLSQILPFLLLAVLAYTIVTPAAEETARPARMNGILLFVIGGIVFGFYDGFFGPGIGSFWVTTLIFFQGFDLTKSIGYSKVMNSTSNLVALALFFMGGMVWLAAGFVMAAGQVTGAWVGSRLVVKRGASFIRPLYICIVLLMTIKLFYDKYF